MQDIVETHRECFNLSYAWSYSISDVVVTTTSDYANNMVTIHHDIDETKNVGRGYTVRQEYSDLNQLPTAT